MAALAIGIGGKVLSTAFSVLAQHSLRLKDAQAENSAVPQAVTALQQDFSEIAQALSNGQATPQEAIAQLIHIEGSIEAFLKSLVGKPGTAWNGTPTGCPGTDVPKTENGAHTCGKTCTAACCIYFSYLEPAIDCFIKRLQKTAPGGSFAVAIPAIAGNKYGFPDFPAYSVIVKVAKTGVSQLTDNVLGSTGILSAFDIGISGGGSPSGAPSSKLRGILVIGLIAAAGLVIAGKK